jgi:hypothetical protein
MDEKVNYDGCLGWKKKGERRSPGYENTKSEAADADL